jgi:hypothetical protein
MLNLLFPIGWKKSGTREKVRSILLFGLQVQSEFIVPILKADEFGILEIFFCVINYAYIKSYIVSKLHCASSRLLRICFRQAHFLVRICYQYLTQKIGEIPPSARLIDRYFVWSEAILPTELLQMFNDAKYEYFIGASSSYRFLNRKKSKFMANFPQFSTPLTPNSRFINTPVHYMT